MIAYIAILLLVAIAEICKAAADLMRNRFDVSIWWRRPMFYDPRISYKYVRKIARYPVDGWHLANSGMITAFCAAIGASALLPDVWWLIGAVFASCGIWFVIVFNLFYNRVFIRKKYRK